MPQRWGLSPYTRGKTRPIATCWVYPRTHGETPPLLGLPGTRVYPRTHGETMVEFNRAMAYGFHGSIPVHTGKPSATGSPRTHGETIGLLSRAHEAGVYPRTHGETMRPSSKVCLQRGLSPYTRGNPGISCKIDHGGSIPVHTGKPMSAGTVL